MATPTEELIASILAGLLKQPPEALTATASFADLGLDSLSGIRLVGALEAHMSIEFDPMIVLDFPSISSLAARIEELARLKCSPTAGTLLVQG